MPSMGHLESQTVPEAGTRPTGERMKKTDVRKKVLFRVDRKWSMQGKLIVQRWQSCFKKLSDVLVEDTSDKPDLLLLQSAPQTIC